MPKPLLRWLVTSIAVSGALFVVFANFDSIELGFGWGLLGLITVTGIFGFSHCVATSPRDNDGSSSGSCDAFFCGDAADF